MRTANTEEWNEYPTRMESTQYGNCVESSHYTVTITNSYQTMVLYSLHTSSETSAKLIESDTIDLLVIILLRTEKQNVSFKYSNVLS